MFIFSRYTSHIPQVVITYKWSYTMEWSQKVLLFINSWISCTSLNGDRRARCPKCLAYHRCSEHTIITFYKSKFYSALAFWSDPISTSYHLFSWLLPKLVHLFLFQRSWNCFIHFNWDLTWISLLIQNYWTKPRMQQLIYGSPYCGSVQLV